MQGLKRQYDYALEHNFRTALAIGLSYTFWENKGTTLYALENPEMANQIVHDLMDKWYYTSFVADTLIGTTVSYFALALLKRKGEPNLPKAIFNIERSAFYTLFGNDQQRDESQKASLRSWKRNIPFNILERTLSVGTLLNQGRIAEGLEVIADELEVYQRYKQDETDKIFSPIVFFMMQSLARVRKRDLRTQIAFAEGCQQLCYEKYLYEVLWPRIHKTYGTGAGRIELLIYQALMMNHNPKRTEEKNRLWERIIEETELNPFRESRNEVYTLSTNPNTKRVIMVKRSNEEEGLQTEYNVLEEIRQKEDPQKRITVTPQALFRGKQGNTILITKRKAAENLDAILNKEPERREQEVEKALESLKIFHDYDLETIPQTRTYNPKEELKRRLLKRFERADTQLFQREYQEFFRRVNPEEGMFIHGDFYPTNVLEGGIILDPEKACYGNIWLDIETFLGAPYFEGLENREELLKQYFIDKTRPRGREFFALHASLCQTGSFSKKDPKTAEYFHRRTEKILKQLGETKLEEAFLQITKHSL
ncbi:phosphotransferase [Candidatus Woesearchaeota archaeon]|nr:phosphotransferase [Candidatus Woesearchaeota archaeon]